MEIVKLELRNKAKAINKANGLIWTTQVLVDDAGDEMIDDS